MKKQLGLVRLAFTVVLVLAHVYCFGETDLDGILVVLLN